MQDKTINNALLALRKNGGTKGDLAEVILKLRGVAWSDIVQDQPLRRGETKRFVMDQVRQGPKTVSQLADALQAAFPDIKRMSAYNRCNLAMLRLADQGRVAQDFGPDGCLWRVG